MPEILFEPENQRLILSFASNEDSEEFVASARRESGFLVDLEQRLRLHDSISVVLAGGDQEARLEARVAQVFDKGFGRFGTAFLVDDWPLLESPTEIETGASPESPEGESEESPATANPDRETTDLPRPDGEMRGASPIHRIKQMNPRQRSMLALKANRIERKILIRDNSPLVLQNLIANPHIETEDVLRLARSSHIVAPLLQRIATDSRWSTNQELLMAIARHPKTPGMFATRLMPSLRTSDLRTMAKMSSGLKEMTRKAALREYLRRTGRRL